MKKKKTAEPERPPVKHVSMEHETDRHVHDNLLKYYDNTLKKINGNANTIIEGKDNMNHYKKLHMFK